MIKRFLNNSALLGCGLLALTAGKAFAVNTNFFANFQGATAGSISAASVLNGGTAIGTWSFNGLPNGVTGAGAISLAGSGNKAAVFGNKLGSTIANMALQWPTTNAANTASNYFQDTGTYPNTYPYDASVAATHLVANFASPGSFTGTSQTVIGFSWGAFGTDNNENAKGQFVRGLDASGNEVFKLLFLAGSSSGTRVVYVRQATDNTLTVTSSQNGTPAGTAVTTGSSGTSWNSVTVNTDPSEYIQVSVLLTNSQVQFTFTHSQFPGSPVTTSFFPVNSSATTISQLEFSEMWNNAVTTTGNKGFWVDNVIVTDGQLPNPKSYLWTGNVNSLWDIATTSNWIDLATALASTYTQGNAGGTTVSFDDTATTGTVSLSTAVSPSVINFSNNTTAYTLSGNGKITGTGTTINFSGSSTVTMNNTNDFVGTSSLNAGRVRLDNVAALGSGLISFNGGTLSSVGSVAMTLTNAVVFAGLANAGIGDATDNGPITFTSQLNLGASSHQITNNSDVNFPNGALSTGNNSALSKKFGTGTLTLSSAVNFTGGSFDILEGTLVLSGAQYTNSARLRPDADSPTTVARLVVTNGTTVFLNANNLNLAVGALDSYGTNIVDLAGMFSTAVPGSGGGAILLDNVGSLYSEVNFLSGGDFTATSVQAGPGGNPTVFNFNGGTLRAWANNATFFQGLTAAYIKSGGAVIDDRGFNITINQDLLDGGGGGGITKLGSGTVTLNSVNNTFTGQTVVSNGTLSLRLPVATSGVTLSTNTTLGVVAGTSSAADWNLSSLNLPGNNGLLFSYASDSAVPANPLLSVSTLTSVGTVSVSVAGLWPVGTYNLLNYSTWSGSPSLVFGALPLGVVGYLTNDTSASAIKLVVTYSAGQKTWYGYSVTDANGYGLWDIATSFNWDGGADQYNDNGTLGDFVTFDSSVSPNPNVSLPAQVQPVAILVTNSSDMAFYGPGKISGSGALTKWQSGNLTLNQTNDYSGGTFVCQGSVTLNINNALPMAGMVTIGSVNNTAYLVLNGFNQTVGGLLGGAGFTSGSRQIYNGSTTPVTLTINPVAGVTNNYIHTLGNNSVANGNNFGVIKNGAGEQDINTCTYSGTTTVNSGRFVFTGNALAVTNTVTVNSGGTLGGAGLIGGPVTLSSGAILSPGNTVGAIGTLVISNNLTMSSGSTNWFDVNSTSGACDKVTNLVDVTYSGALIVNNASTNAFTGTQNFSLFSATGATSGNFSSIVVLPNTGATGTFNPSTGILTITAVPTTPTNLLFSVSGGTMTLSWPANYLGWQLQIQTNSLNTGLGTNWVTVPGSASVTSTNFPIVPGNPAMFFRMVH